MNTPICEPRRFGVLTTLFVILFAVLGFAAIDVEGTTTRTAKSPAAGHAVFGKTVSADGSALPGVLIAISGDGINLKGVSDTDGAFRFASVPAGSYSIVFKMKGAKKVKREITVSTGDLDLGEITLG